VLKSLGVQVDPGTPIPCVDGCPSAWISVPSRDQTHPDRSASEVVRRLLAHGYTDNTTTVRPAASTDPSVTPATSAPTATPSASTPAPASACLDQLTSAPTWSCDLIGPHARVGLNTEGDGSTFEIKAQGNTRLAERGFDVTVFGH
jgi:hypothetical protein